MIEDTLALIGHRLGYATKGDRPRTCFSQIVEGILPTHAHE